MNDFRGINNKVVVITGGCGDIGGATAKKLAALGAQVVIFDLLDEQAGLARTLDLGGVAYKKADQGDGAQVQKAIDRVAAEFNRLDVVIGNAGIGPGGGVLEATESDWLQVLRVNLIGCAMLAQAALKHMGFAADSCLPVRGWEPIPRRERMRTRSARQGWIIW
jgi:NAD(P)-dependent dehydrogenase (short-subunit alcohol dehydrogenase family)